ncbi:type II toxin-antitoxin system Phd/YefM family antitoxin [Methyloversatilis discipulorum]|uniref:type II toxin-antitoxin system Phd/YefM family antitoxin n=1 Tax=Methyloversatilis discipulorum TaxID=1119528 RepID=UPI001A588636|nr:type II toxin-antitoxin system prevent-host-death family antitoxin [Methyloversatilis discipulorum]MBL8467756.1 type II toxin-antitoxin system prevent-host-death family antitoxin [Methyloversatilis discipulorum]
METVGIAKAKTLLSRLVAKLEDGELNEVVITRAGHPVAKLVPVAVATGKRIGVAKGIFEVPDDIYAPHNAEIESMFNGK